MVAATAFGTEADVGGDGGGSLELTAVAPVTGKSLGGSGRDSSMRENACRFRWLSWTFLPPRLVRFYLAAGEAVSIPHPLPQEFALE